MSCSGTPGPPPKRLRSVDSSICSPMSITNPSTPGSYKPPTPATYKPPTPAARPITPSSTPGPKTPQSNNNNNMNTVVMSSSSSINNSDSSKFAVPSPSMHPVSSQPQLLRQHSQASTSSVNPQSTPCNLAASQGMLFRKFSLKLFLILVLLLKNINQFEISCVSLAVDISYNTYP